MKANFQHPCGKLRLMFQDEAGFGRINKPKYCWCKKGFRPSVPCHHIREYNYLYGAACPQDGEFFSLILPRCNTDCMNIFLDHLSKEYPDDFILLLADNAVWHKSRGLSVPNNIEIFPLLPYTPELNPIEQLWAEIREKGFKNELFPTLDKVMDRLCSTIQSLKNHTIKSVISRKWLLSLS